ncbi:ribbon-helix-helix domain-containing protein [Gemmata sp.]|uniref:ribbon-helix-helix domain-containing protein n=1 Tax=Gemmata sp. TaxID=1914242 RepID=UPI003F70921A
MTITLPDEMRDRLERDARAGGFATVDEYVLSLVREDLVRGDEVPDPAPTRLTPRNRAELEAMLDEGMSSGGDVIADAAFRGERRRVLLEKLARKSGVAS